MQNRPPHKPQYLSLSPGLLTIVIIFTSGICLSKIIKIHNRFSLLAIIFIFCLLLAADRFKFRGRCLTIHTLFVLLFLIIGYHHALVKSIPPSAPNHIFNQIQTPQTASLYGILTEYPSVNSSTSPPKTGFIMDVQSIFRGDVGEDLKSSGLVQLTINGMLPKELEPGDHILAKARLAGIRTFSTPGVFNYKKHLESKAIFIKGWVETPVNIIKVNTGKPARSAFTVTSLCSFPQRVRCSIAAFLSRSLPQPARGLYKAILIGDRNDIEPSVLEKFIVSGCIHILAISGMHMGLLAFISIGVLTWLLKRSTWLMLKVNIRKLAVVLSLVPITFYAFIAGLNLPVLRSLLMTSVFILAVMFDRPGNLFNHVLLAGLLIIVWKPAALFTAAFQLSFSAVIAIALAGPLILTILPPKTSSGTKMVSTAGGSGSLIKFFSANPVHWLLSGVAVTLAAMAGTFPLLLFHFNRISLIAPLANLLVEPLICFWSLIIGIAATIFIPISSDAARFLFDLGSQGLLLADRLCTYLSVIPYASLRLPTPSIPEITAYYIFVLSTVIAFHKAVARRRFFIMIAALACCILLAMPAINGLSRRVSASTSVAVLDVGHGSAVFVHLPHDKNILIDGGGAGNDDFNIGERVIAPFLWHKRLSNLDAVVITHPHTDHYNGLPFILEHFHPKELWINGIAGEEVQYGHLIDLARRLDIAVRIPGKGDVLFASGGTRLRCVDNGALPESIYRSKLSAELSRKPEINDTSLVLRLDTPNHSFLFPADISSSLAESMVEAESNLRADILLAPHHGSRTSMSLKFLKAVAPKYIVVSAGRNGPSGFQDSSFHSLNENNLQVLITGNDGTLTFTERQGAITMNRYQVN